MKVLEDENEFPEEITTKLENSKELETFMKGLQEPPTTT